jgi:hypothetical protein
LPLNLTKHIVIEPALIYYSTTRLSTYYSRPIDFLLDNAADYNIVLWRVVRELDIELIKDVVLPDPLGF